MRAGKVVLALVLVAVVLGIGGGVLWYLSVPHTADEQFAYAEKLAKKLEGDAVSKSPKELAPDIDKTVAAFKAVGGKFGKGPKAVEGLKRAAGIEEKIAKDDAKAMGIWERVVKDYPAADDAGQALMEEARLLRAEADVLNAGKPGEAAAKYKQALAKLEQYRSEFAKDSKAKPDAALMEIGRIWQDGLGEPLIHVIETFQQFLKDYPMSDDRPEAMFRLGRALEQAHEYERALTLYGQLVEEFPKSKWAGDATLARGKILADQLHKHDEAAKEFEKFQQEHPESSMGKMAGARAKEEQGKAGSEGGKKYSEGRYGGNLPYDTLRDKPMPPTGMFEQFARQKLDAQKYDLKVAFVPRQHRITVTGTLKVKNGGDPKGKLLLMLGAPLEISSLTVDGKKATYRHEGETLTIDLAQELKTGDAVTLGFTYSGQYAAAEPPPEAGPSSESESKKSPATRPAIPPSTATAPREARLPSSPQIALGDYGYALSGAAWYPITIIGDVFEAHVVMKTPANFEAVTNGAVVRRDKSLKEGTQGVFEFETRQPVFGLYFAYGPYVVREQTLGPIHYYTYFRQKNDAKSGAYLEAANKILTFYSSKFVPFPYEKMALVEVPLPPFLGGVGPASLMFLQAQMVDRKEVPVNLLAHELAHQWFGNRVPINMADEGYNQWLSEGFATYCDALYTEHTDGPKALATHMQRYGQLFFQFYMMAPRGQGAIRSTFPGSLLYRPVIYEKGAIVLHMLRKVMGDAKFFELLRQYVETYQNKPTTMADFRRLADKVNGADLSWFFSEWIDQSIFAHWTLDVTVRGSGTAASPAKVTMKIAQPDDLVKMPADITMIGAAGERQVVPNVMLDQKEQTVEASVPFVPVKVIIDEDYWVLRHPGSDNIWPRATEKAAAP